MKWKPISELSECKPNTIFYTSNGKVMTIRFDRFDVEWHVDKYNITHYMETVSPDVEIIILKKETAEELSLLVNNLISGHKPYYSKQKDALKTLENKLL